MVGVLLLHDGDDIRVGAPGIEGLEISARVIAHRRGPRIEVLRYKSKKRVRVHRGGRADLTAIEILPFGSKPEADKAEKREDKAAAPKARARSKPQTAARKPRVPKTKEPS